MNQIVLETNSVAVLADGKTTSDISNNRGHLLEVFVAKVLAQMGYNDPRTENLNVTSEGVEIDVVAKHRITGDRAICECKAYSSNIATHHLTSFLGKFALERADDDRAFGLFVGLPRLTAEGIEKAQSAEKKIPGFRYLGSTELIEILDGAKLIPDPARGPEDRSDLTLIVTAYGLALAALEIDPNTRRAGRWVIWTKDGLVPPDIIRLVEQNMAGGLPVVAIESGTHAIPTKVPSLPTVIEVRGSSSDFEYQLPAAPAYFVGRKDLLKSLVDEVSTRSKAGSIVVNAKSGWGKSSLALQIQSRVEKAGGASLVVDTRTAERADYVVAALERLIRLAESKKLVTLPPNPAFSSLQAVVQTLRASYWTNPARPAFIAFDQFENAFRYEDLTREFRDLALMVRELDIPLTVSFSWKTDLVGWTEGHPYRWRDEIRDASRVEVLDPLGPREIETLLRRLEKELGEKLTKDLRQRLREYSQGLPWLFKKLGGHVLSEVKGGVSQEELIRQGLNVEALFKSDLDRLNPNEQGVLRSIAQQAPVLVADLDLNAVPSNILDSLLHQRLVVQVGDRLDIYWDTFRDFLNTGRVQVEDSYVVRYAPHGAGKLLRVLMEAGGRMSVADAALQVGTTVTVIFNYARELRLFGVLSTEPNYLLVESEILAVPDREDAVRARVAQALRRHKMYKLATEALGQQDRISFVEFAAMLPGQFPSVEAKSDSWLTYARSFAQWMDYAGLVRVDRDGFTRVEEAADPTSHLLTGEAPIRMRKPFPSSNAGPAVALLLHVNDPARYPRPSSRSVAAAARDLATLGFVEQLDSGQISLIDEEIVMDGVLNAERLRERLEAQRGLSEALTLLESKPAAPPAAVGTIIRDALGAEWADSTTKSVGKFTRAWARLAGISTVLRER